MLASLSQVELTFELNLDLFGELGLASWSELSVSAALFSPKTFPSLFS